MTEDEEKEYELVLRDLFALVSLFKGVVPAQVYVVADICMKHREEK